MAAIGIIHGEIALALGISDETLRKYFKNELKTGKTKTIAKMADSLVRQGLAGNVTALIFYLKTQAAWRETPLSEADEDTKILRVIIENDPDAGRKS